MRYTGSVALALCLAGSAWFFGQAVWLQAKALLAQHLIASAWSETVAAGRWTTPWPWADTWPVARLTTPAGERLFVLNGTHGQALAFGPGHLTASGLPGQGGPVVLAGHRDSHFAFLRGLAPDDVLSLQGPDGRERTYRVADLSVVDSRVARLDAVSGLERLVLVTCYPFHSLNAGGPLRYVVTAVPEGGHVRVDSPH